MQDLRLALRAVRATPMVSTVAILSLALGIGANTAIFSILNGLLLKPLPVYDPYQRTFGRARFSGAPHECRHHSSRGREP